MLGLQFEDAMKEEVNTDQINITLSSDIEWLHLVQSRVFSQSYEFPKLYDWSTTQIGTFFAKALPIFYKITKKDPFVSLGLMKLHKIFTLPGQEMSLIDIGPNLLLY